MSWTGVGGGEEEQAIELHEAARGGSMVPAPTEDDGAPAAGKWKR